MDNRKRLSKMGSRLVKAMTSDTVTYRQSKSGVEHVVPGYLLTKEVVKDPIGGQTSYQAAKHFIVSDLPVTEDAHARTDTLTDVDGVVWLVSNLDVMGSGMTKVYVSQTTRK